MTALNNKKLTLNVIAERWSREVSPKETHSEIFCRLLQAFWAGEFDEANTPDQEIRRIKLLKALYVQNQSNLTDSTVLFLTGNKHRPKEQKNKDGSVTVDLRTQIIIPNQKQKSWTIENSAPAFAVLQAECAPPCSCLPAYMHAAPTAVFLYATEIDYNLFSRWVKNQKIRVPKFWKPSPDPPRNAGNASRFDVEKVFEAYKQKAENEGQNLSQKRAWDDLKNHLPNARHKQLKEIYPETSRGRPRVIKP